MREVVRSKPLKSTPHRLAAMRTLAQAAMQERKYSDALPYLRELAKQNPRDLTTRVQLATACSQTGELQEALTNLDSALKPAIPTKREVCTINWGQFFAVLDALAEANRAFAEAKVLSDRFQNTSLRDKEPKE